MHKNAEVKKEHWYARIWKQGVPIKGYGSNPDDTNQTLLEFRIELLWYWINFSQFLFSQHVLNKFGFYPIKIVRLYKVKDTSNC